MKTEEILQHFLDLSNANVRQWLTLLQNNIHFTPKEKGLFIIEYNTYKSEQINNFILQLENIELSDKELKDKHPDEYQRYVKGIQEAWEFLIKQLEVHIIEETHEKQLRGDKIDIEHFRKKILDNF